MLISLAQTLPLGVFAQDFEINRISRNEAGNQDPVISETGLAAWTYYEKGQNSSAFSHIAVYDAKSRSLNDKSLLLFTGANKLVAHGNSLAFVSGFLDTKTKRLGRPQPKVEGVTNTFSDIAAGSIDSYASNAVSFNFGELNAADSTAKNSSAGLSTIWVWNYGEQNIRRMQTYRLSNMSPALWGDLVAWQWEQDWPFGYEIMFSVTGSDPVQLTTNKYYELSPQIHDDKIVWFGWDGYDYEIFMHDVTRGETLQITSNRFDDTGPRIYNNVIVWEGYASVEADIYMWKDGTVTQISDNVDDDNNPQIWEDKIVWQGFDGDDFEIYLYDVTKGGPAVKLTSNNFDDVNPKIHDNLVAWMGYHDNWDSEIYAADLTGMTSPADVNIVRLTDNDFEDQEVQTAGRRIVWVTQEEGGLPQIMLAEPR